MRQIFAPSFLCVAMMATSVGASAQLGGPSGVNIPYQGRLDIGGAPANGVFSFRFGVFDVAVDGTECDSHEESTLVSNGSFSVVLGPVLEACVRNKDIFVEISVKENVSDTFTTFAERQRIHAATSASTSGRGDFSISGHVDVAGDLNVAGATDSGPLTATSVTTPGQVASGSVSTQATTTGSLSVTSSTSFPANSISGAALVDGSIPVSKNAVAALACVTNTASLGAAGGYRQVAATLPAGYTRTGGGCSCGSANPGRLMVFNIPSGTNQWLCGCKDHVNGDGNAGTTAYVIGCRNR